MAPKQECHGFGQRLDGIRRKVVEIDEVIRIPEAPDKLLKPPTPTRIRTDSEKLGDCRNGIFHLIWGHRLLKSFDFAHLVFQFRQRCRLLVRLV